MRLKMLPLIVLLQFSLASQVWSQQSGLEDNQVSEGGYALFRCDLDGRYPCQSVNWMKETPLGTRTISSCRTTMTGNDRFTVSYDVYNNAYTLRIRNLTIADNGRYYCRAQNGIRYFQLRGSSLTVVKRSWPMPICDLHPLIRHQYARVGTVLRFTCSLPTNSAPADITWRTTYARVLHKQRIEPGGKHSLLWNVGISDNTTVFSCFAGNDYTDRGPLCSLPPLQVLPAVVEPRVVRKLKGKSADFHCNLKFDRSQIISYKWIVQPEGGQQEVFNSTTGRYRFKNEGQSFRIKNVVLQDNATRVWCEVTDERNQSLNSAKDPDVLHVFSPYSEQAKDKPTPESLLAYQTSTADNEQPDNVFSSFTPITKSDKLKPIKPTETVNEEENTLESTPYSANKTEISFSSISESANETNIRYKISQQLPTTTLAQQDSDDVTSGYIKNFKSAKNIHVPILIWSILAILMILLIVVIVLTVVILRDRRSRRDNLETVEKSEPDVNVIRLDIDLKSIPIDKNGHIYSNWPISKKPAITAGCNTNVCKKPAITARKGYDTNEVVYALPHEQRISEIDTSKDTPQKPVRYFEPGSSIVPSNNNNSLQQVRKLKSIKRKSVIYALPQQKGGGHFEVAPEV